MVRNTNLHSFQSGLRDDPMRADMDAARDAEAGGGAAVAERNPLTGGLIDDAPAEAPAEHEYDVNGRGEVNDWRDYGPGRLATDEQAPYEPKTHTITDDDDYPIGDLGYAKMELPGMPAAEEAEQDADEASQPDPKRLDRSAWGTVRDAEKKALILWPIKSTSEFHEEMLSGAHDLDDMVDYLIRSVPALNPLGMISIRWYWRRQGGKSGGKPVLVQVKKADEALAHERDCDIIVKLSADHLRKMRASALFVEYLVCAALARIDADGPKVSPSDVWARLPVWWRYGLLGPDDRLFGQLFEGVQDGTASDTTGSPEPSEGGEPGPESPSDSAGVLIHDDGTPLTADEIAEMERRELEDDDFDPAQADLSDLPDGDAEDGTDGPGIRAATPCRLCGIVLPADEMRAFVCSGCGQFICPNHPNRPDGPHAPQAHDVVGVG